MVGGKKDELVINSTNVFAALGSFKKKKKSTQKEQGSSKSSKVKTTEKVKENEVFWAPAPLTVKSWADVDDEDDDDYYATTAPPQSVWGATESDAKIEEAQEPAVEESESEVEDLDEVDDDVEEEHENENETETLVKVEQPIVKDPPEAPAAPKDAERQLSKKELKKKGLEELDALLAEMGLNKESGQDGSHGITQEKTGEDNGNVEKKENASGETKSSKKKKKKDKSSKEAKEPSQDQPDGSKVEDGTDEAADTQKTADASVDVKERLKKVVSIKKKKSSKEMDAAARAAASEAAARNARLAAAKKKEKNHYNQQPVR